MTFRRSRTLTGSTAEEVRTVSESRAQLKSPRLREHELRSHRRKLSGYLFGALSVAGLLMLLLSQYVGIISVNVVSSAPLRAQPNKAEYAALINEYFAGRPFERFRFALDEAALTRFLAAKAPEVASLKFDNTGIATAVADIRFRVPVVTWQLSSQRSYVDGEGHAYLKNYYNEPSVTVKDESGIDATSGAIVSDRFLQFMGRVIALTNASGVTTITGATIPRNTTREIDFALEGRGYIVKTQLGRDPASQTADVINAVKYMDNKGIKPSYVDVRIASKAIYR